MNFLESFDSAAFLESFNSVALILDTIGTILWAHNGVYSKYAGLFWLAPLLVWDFYGAFTGVTAPSMREGFTILLYLYGSYRWLRPKTIPKKI